MMIAMVVGLVMMMTFCPSPKPRHISHDALSHARALLVVVAAFF
jgi:hypothetical protein